METNSLFRKALYWAGGVLGVLLVLALLLTMYNSVAGRNGQTFGMMNGVDFAATDEGLSFNLGKAVAQKITARQLGVAADSSGSAESALAPSAPDTGSGEMTEKKIIRNGSLNLFVDKPEDSAKSVEELALAAGGSVQSSSVYEVRNGVKAGYVVVRVPADKFFSVMTEIKKIARQVDREEVESSDVTEQYVDLTAQLSNAQAEEKQYLVVLGQAQKINDILQVTQYLNQTREKIERLQGQLKYLSQQVDLSTIRVNLTAYDDISVWGIRWKPLYQIKLAARNLLSGLASYATAMINLIIALPLVILWLATVLVVIWLIWKIIHWAYYKIKK